MNEDTIRRERRRSDAPGRYPPPKDDLPLILTEIASVLGGRAAMLSQHPTDNAAGLIVEMSPAVRISGQASAALDLATAFAATAVDGECIWSEGIFRLGSAAMFIPVERVQGQGRLIVSVFFDALTDAAMELAENLYRARRPLMNGYFRLWQTERALRDRLRTTEAAFNQTDTGFLLLNRVGDILFANVAAQTMLDAGDGLRRLRSSVGATRIADSVTLQVALNHVIAANADQETGTPPPAPMVALARESGPPLIAVLLATPVRAIGPADAAIAMYVNDPMVDTAAMLGPVCRLYGLSPVETNLATHLAQGLPLAEAAKRMNIRELTARTYMKQIFLKTETNRQTELVVLMLSSLVRMRPTLVQAVLPLANEPAVAG